MKTKKQILSAVLSLCLCLTLFGSVNAQAATAKPISTEADLESAFFDGGSYVLKNSITLTKELNLTNIASADTVFGKDDVTIDFNGFTVSSNTTVLSIGAYGPNGKGNITLLDSQGGGGIAASGLVAPAILIRNNAGDCYSSVLTIRGGVYSGSDCAISIADGMSQNVNIEAGIFSYTGKSGMPIRGAYSASSTPVYSPDGKTLTFSSNLPEPTSSTSQPTSETTSSTDTSEPTSDNGQNSQTQKQAAQLDVNTDIPRASYTVSIPATISVPTLERVRADAAEAEKISRTPFAVSIENVEHFFNEKSVHVTLNSDYIMENTVNPEDTLVFNITQNETDYADGAVFAELDESNKQASGAIIIDKSTIRKSGNYQGKIEFIFDLQS